MGGATVTLDDQNSLSSYADDFADDESILPPAQHTTTAPPSSEKPSAVSTTTTADSGGGGHTATQQEEGDQSQHSPAADLPASSQADSSESNTEVNTNGGGGNHENNQHDSSRGRVGEEGIDQRRQSGSRKKSGTGMGGDGGNTNASGTEVYEHDVGRRAASKVDSSPSVSELEDRLREADIENARLREAMEKSAAASTGGSGDDRRELETLKRQVEAAK